MRQNRTYADNVTIRYCVTLLVVVTAAPVTAAPVAAATPTPMTAAPTPMAAAPAPVAAPAATPAPATAPAHLFGLQMFHLVPGGDSRTGILVRRRQRSAFCERMRHKRCCPRTRGQCGGARGKSKGQFQKVAAFHDIFLSVRASDAERVSPGRDERWLNREPFTGAITPSRFREREDPGAETLQLKGGESTRTASTPVVVV